MAEFVQVFDGADLELVTHMVLSDIGGHLPIFAPPCELESILRGLASFSPPVTANPSHEPSTRNAGARKCPERGVFGFLVHRPIARMVSWTPQPGRAGSG